MRSKRLVAVGLILSLVGSGCAALPYGGSKAAPQQHTVHTPANHAQGNELARDGSARVEDMHTPSRGFSGLGP